MSQAYKIHKQDAAYFLTLQVVYWVDIFSRKRYRDIVTDSLNFCVKEKGLEIYSYVIMTNHLHMVVRSSKGNLSDVVRDFKRHTSRHLVKSIFTEAESRRYWILKLFSPSLVVVLKRRPPRKATTTMLHICGYSF
jgi:REP element-mobilizing transposase RayT